MAIHRTCRSRNVKPLPVCWPAVTADALNTITAPMKHSASVTPNNCRSGCKLRGIVGTFLERDFSSRHPGCAAARFAPEPRHKLLENAVTVLVVFELVETGAGRRKKHHISGLRAFRSDLNSTANRARMLHRNGAFKLRSDFLCGSADQ